MRILALALFIGAFATAPLNASADGRVVGCDPEKPNGREFDVYFDTGSSSVRAQDRERLAQAANWATGRYIQKICLLAYSDPRGGVEANRALSLKRAASVQSDLRKRGVKAKIESHALGEAPGGFLGLISDDEQEDRRVRIVMVR